MGFDRFSGHRTTLLSRQKIQCNKKVFILKDLLPIFKTSPVFLQGDRIWIDFYFFAGTARSYACQSFGSTPFSVRAGHTCDQIFLIRALNAVTLRFFIYLAAPGPFRGSRMDRQSPITL
ncbi:hypothetical protein [Desulfosarcina ovata]|uniref:hypothetical protein n=1 Tax=Desulfosarcina ovata TaxID=83564 RepID=UPI0012D3426C|nr:hypothetical protein [Desulfosarcina ovata]